MTWLPTNAMSELIPFANSGAGGVFDRSRRFHDAFPAASIAPARSPTRGSGLGAAIDKVLAGEEEDPAHPATDSAARTGRRRKGAAVDREPSGHVLSANPMRVS